MLRLVAHQTPMWLLFWRQKNTASCIFWPSPVNLTDLDCRSEMRTRIEEVTRVPSLSPKGWVNASHLHPIVVFLLEPKCNHILLESSLGFTNEMWHLSSVMRYLKRHHIKQVEADGSDVLLIDVRAPPRGQWLYCNYKLSRIIRNSLITFHISQT